jgi:hypothetical protein
MNWKIENLERKTQDGFVTTAHWRCEADSVSAYGSVSFSGDLTTPYESLTESQVLGWVWEQVNKDEIEASLTAQINKKKMSAAGVPWDE